MSEWKEEPLENVTLFIKDGSHGTHKDYENGIPLLSAKDVVNGKVLIPEDCRRISSKDFDQIHSNYQIQENDLALTIVGTIGRVALVENKNQKFTFQRSVGIFRVDTLKLNPRYCYHFFTSDQFQQSLERSKNASAQGGVYLGELSKIKISFPVELIEQRYISRILSTADAVIEKTQAAIAKYKAIKQGMLQDLFTRGIDVATGKLRPSYQDAPELYKESKLGFIPKEWEVEEIGNIIHIKHGYSFEGKYFSNEKSEYILLTPGNFNVDGSLYFQERNTKYYKGEIPSEFVFENGDLLTVMTDLTQDMNILGNVVKLYSSYKVLHNQRIGKIELLKNNLDVDYLLFILNTPFSKDNIKKTATGTTVRHTSPNHIYKGIIPIPKYKEQNKIAERIIVIDKKINTEQKYLHKLQQLKAGLMRDLLSARKKVKTDENLLTQTEK